MQGMLNMIKISRETDLVALTAFILSLVIGFYELAMFFKGNDVSISAPDKVILQLNKNKKILDYYI